MSVALAAGGATASSAATEQARKPDLWSPFSLPSTPSVDVTQGASDVAARAKTVLAKSPRMNAFHPAAPHWPAATSTKLNLSGGSGHATGTPVTLGKAGTLDKGLLPRTKTGTHAIDRAPTAGSFKVSVASRPAGAKAGVQGLLVSLSRTDRSEAAAGASRLSVALDYGSVKDAYGGDYASRLRLVRLPACALTTPTKPSCRTQIPVTASANDLSGHRLVGEIALPATSVTTPSAMSAAGTMVLAATAAPAGTSGTYAATSLSPSGSWSSSGNTGAFTYSYPVTAPESVGGDAPQVALSYNSASVDGRTSATNNQASWVGDGWEYSPGFIERSYRACADDGQSGDNDECWAGDNATLSLAGHSGELVPAGSGKWRLADDDGSLVEELSGASNGLNNGTYWRLTTDDGTQYYFGADHLPTAAGGDGTDTTTNSAWGVPVYGNGSGEPCHASTFAASSCTQGWRWNLDFTVDPHHNITVDGYKAETNYYGAGSAHTLTKYTRGGYPATISYGQQVADYVAKATPAAQIAFTAAQRCDGLSGVDCSLAPTSSTASHWPDVPFDENCASSGTCTNYTPTFWSTMRLSKITTKVWDESLATPAWSTVDTYTLGQTYPDPGDGTKPAMWLSTVQHTGSDTRGGGSAVSLPALTLQGQATLPNRVDGLEEPQNIPPINRYRLLSLTTETGDNITVTYKPSSCSRTSPPAEDADTQPCYPVRWTPPGYSSPILDWFYTYPVAEVDENDISVTGSPSLVTTYNYLGGAAWHRDDSELTVAKYRTWGDFRGYEQVVTHSGKSPDPITETSTHYLRGMDGDTTASGSTTSVKVTDYLGNTLTDDGALSGFAYETSQYTQDSGAGGTVESQTVDHPWLSAATATHARSSGLPDQVARFSDIDRTYTRQKKADGSWRTSETTTAFDGATGLSTQVDDKGEVDSSGTPVVGAGTPEECTTTRYASDASRNMYSYPSEVITEAGGCVSTPDAHTLADTRTWYDKGATDTVAGPGDATSTQKAKDFAADGTIEWAAAATAGYDAYGRVTSTSDPLGRATTTTYSDSSSTAATKKKYLPVTIVTTNAKKWPATTTFDAGRQLPLLTTDSNNRVTTETYDGLGRLTQVWLPDHTQSANTSTPNYKFTYTVSKTAPTVVESQNYRDGGDYGADFRIYDAMLRLRQEQATPLDDSTGRLITDTSYDSHGWTASTDAAYYNSASAPTGTFVTPVIAQVPANARTTYDGQGRATASTLYSLGTQQWKTTTAYPGADRTDVTPPSGGTPSTTLTDARGHTTELRQYHGATPAGTYDKTVFTYDSAGRDVTKTGPLDASASTTDAAAKSLTWTTGYDLLGDINSQSDPDTGTTPNTYDDDGELTKTVDARPNGAGSVSTAYDALGRVTDTYGWDAATVSSTHLTHRDYDTLTKGELTDAISYEAGKAVYTDTVAGYTTAYKPTGATISIPAGAFGNTAAISYTTKNTYTPVQELLDTSAISTTGTGGLIPDETLGFGYNGVGMPVTSGGADTYTSWINYSPFGQATRATMGVKPLQVVTTNSWEPATGRLLTHTVNKEDATAATDTVGYTYDQSGRITSTSDVQDTGGTANTDTQCYAYDYLSRLTDVWSDTGATHTAASPTVNGIGGCDDTTPSTAHLGGPAPYWQSYGYDLTGNRTSRTDHDPSGDTSMNVTTDEAYDTAGHAHGVHTVSTGTSTGTYAYDAAGNPTTMTTTSAGQDQPSKAQSFTWNARGQLAGLTTGPANAPVHTSGYHYDADGGLLARTDDGTTTVYLGVDEITFTAGTAASAARYYKLGSAPTAVRVAKAGTSGTRLSYQTADPHGTATDDITADTLTVTRRLFTPFGESRDAASVAWPGDHGFVGGTQDPTTGLTNLGAREYDPALGRFLDPDPLLDAGDPQQWNGYSYSDDDPVNASDPTGRHLLCGNDDPDHVPCPKPPKPSTEKPASSDDDSGPKRTTTIGNVTVSGTSQQITKLKKLYRKLYRGDASVPLEWNTAEDGDYLVPQAVRSSYADLVTWEAVCRKPGMCGKLLSSTVKMAADGMRKAVDKSIHGWKCFVFAWGCGNVPTAAAAYVPRYVYRGASGTYQSMTPRAIDTEGLSSWDKPNRIQGKVQIIDTQKLGDDLEAVPDGGGHVSIRPKDMSEMEGWIASRATANDSPHPFTEVLKDAIIDASEIAE